MTDQMKQISLRIRELRESLDLTREEFALATQTPLTTYSAYEDAQIDIPISFLLTLSQKYDIDPTTILTGEAPRLSVCAITRKDMGVAVTRAHHYIYKNLAFNFNHRKIEPLLVTVNPGVNKDLETNSHEGHEFDYVLTGVLRLRVGDHDVILNPGDSAYYDSKHPHAMQAASNEPCQFLAMVIP